MSLFLSKLLPRLVYPLGLTSGLLLLAIFFIWWGRRRLSAAFLLLALSILWVSAMPVTAAWLSASLERLYLPVPVAQSPTDYEAVGQGEHTLLDWLPDARSLEHTTRAGVPGICGVWVAGLDLKRQRYPVKGIYQTQARSLHYGKRAPVFDPIFLDLHALTQWRIAWPFVVC